MLLEINEFYRNLEFTFKEVAWDALFRQAALGDEFVQFGGVPEFFWEEPNIRHAGKLNWLCASQRYVSVARVDINGVDMLVVPRWESTPFWDWNHGGENIFIWHVPEMTVQEICRETEQDYL